MSGKLERNAWTVSMNIIDIHNAAVKPVCRSISTTPDKSVEDNISVKVLKSWSIDQINGGK